MIRTGDLSIYEGKPFGNIMLRSDYSELIRLGFRPGDSVDVRFSGGAALEDIPFLSGCILPEGMLCLNAHESFDWIRVEKRFGNAWSLYGVREGETGRVTLREPGKYAFLHRVFNTEFSLEREDYPSDECFANYRPLGCGRLRKGTLYRSLASFDPLSTAPVFRKRQKYLDGLMERDGIRFVINMCCSPQRMEEFFASGEYDGFYIQKLYNEGNVFSDVFPVDYSGPAFRERLAAALRALPGHGGPYLIQCKAGLDRTGFLCGLLAALAGAEASEIIGDYMRSFDSLFGLTREGDREKYDVLRRCQADRVLEIIAGRGAPPERDFSLEALALTPKEPGYEVDLRASAEEYLLGCGLQEAEIARLEKLLTE